VRARLSASARDPFRGLLVVVPTRNRSDLAEAAIRSVLDQGDGEVSVLVSDNSTKAEQAEALAAFCKAEPSGRLRYARPPRPLPMDEHWEWVLERALDGEVDHVLYLTDRMVLRPGALAEIAALVRRHPDQVLTYNHDRIDDARVPVRLEQRRWTGRLLRLSSAKLRQLASECVPLPWLPRMLNCVVPRRVLDDVKASYGHVFLKGDHEDRRGSTSPDFRFGFRCLARVESILHLDHYLLVHYAMTRSNGATFARGMASPDTAQFDPAELNLAAPVPGFLTIMNAVVHEYCAVRSETSSPRFPEIDRRKYLQAIAGEIAEIENPELRERMRVLMSAQGARPGPSRRALLRKARRATWWLSRGPLQPFWRAAARRFRAYPPGDAPLHFATVEEALEHARRYPRRRHRSTYHLELQLGDLDIVEA
jgi:hypothetical protein